MPVTLYCSDETTDGTSTIFVAEILVERSRHDHILPRVAFCWIR